MAFVTTMTAVLTFVLQTFEQMRVGAATTTEAMRAQVVALVQTMADQVAAILTWLVEQGRTAGVALGNSVADGIRASTGAAVAAAQALAAAVRANLPHSDADEGPLSDITASGRALPETLARGMLAGRKRTEAAARTIAQGMRPALQVNGNRAAGAGAAGKGLEDFARVVRVFVTNWPGDMAGAGAAAGDAARAYERAADETKRIADGIDAGLGNQIGLPRLDEDKRGQNADAGLGNRIGLPLIDDLKAAGKYVTEAVNSVLPRGGALDWTLAGRNADCGYAGQRAQRAGPGAEQAGREADAAGAERDDQ